MTQTNKTYNETYVVTGPIMWARVFTPDENGKFTLEFNVTNKSDEDFFKGLGLTIKTDKKDPPRKFVQMQRYATDTEGNVKPFRIVDAKLNTFEDLIGNNSTCKCEFFVKDWTYGKRSGKYAYITGLQVLEHIKYKPKPKAGKFTVEEEYVEAAEETSKFAAGS